MATGREKRSIAGAKMKDILKELAPKYDTADESDEEYQESLSGEGGHDTHHVEPGKSQEQHSQLNAEGTAIVNENESEKESVALEKQLQEIRLAVLKQKIENEKKELLRLQRDSTMPSGHVHATLTDHDNGARMGIHRDTAAEPSKTKNQNRHKQADTDDDTDSDGDSDSDEDEEYSPKKDITVNAKNVQLGSKNTIIQNNYTVPESEKEETQKQDKSSPKKGKRVNTENFQLGSKNTIIQNNYTVPEPKKEETQKQVKDKSRDVPEVGDGNTGDVPEVGDGNTGDVPEVGDGNTGDVPEVGDGNTGDVPEVGDGNTGDVPEVGDGKQFKNTDGNALPGLAIDMLKEAKKSVGIIRGPGNLQGTGFLLRECKVMTAYHVIKDTVSEEGKTKTPNRRYTLDKKISIQFDYEEAINAGKKETTFYFTSDIPYVNIELDVVVLQLSSEENTENLPQPLKYFSKVKNMKAHMIGHPEGGILMVDLNIERLKLTDKEYDERVAWSQTEYKGNGYDGIKDSQKILFHSRFAHGASGCPGCYADINKKKVEVVWMLLKGYPEFYYGSKLTPEQQSNIRNSYVMEQGVKMEAIWKDMLQKQPDLYRTIFEHNN